jgi:hypothetical protein
MMIINGSMLRANQSMRLRTGPGTKYAIKAGINPGVLVQALGPPANNWLHCIIHGHQHADYPGSVFSEPDTKSSVDARRGADPWRSVAITGYASMGNAAWWTVVDGPQEATA